MSRSHINKLFMYFSDSKKSRILVLKGNYQKLAFAALSLLILTSCGENNSTSTSGEPVSNSAPLGSNESQQFAFIAGLIPNTNERRIDRILIDENTISLDGHFPTILSDIGLATDGTQLYQLGQLGTDNITQFDPEDTSGFNYQLSTNGENETASNPQALAFIDETKAYLTRRGSDDLWIVNPTPEIGENLQISTIDLDAYDTDLPDMTDAIIVDDKLFVLMERLQTLPNGNEIPDKNGFIAVFETRGDIEINTNQSPSDLKGIELLVSSPTALQYNEDTAQIYVVGQGNFLENTEIAGDSYNGGVEIIDPTTYQHSLLLDDGNSENNSGYFFDLAVVNAQLAYLVTYNGAESKTLRSFNPATGILNNDVFDVLQNVDITSLAIGPDNHLWVGLNEQGAPGIYRISIESGDLVPEKVATDVIPSAIVFIATNPDN